MQMGPGLRRAALAVHVVSSVGWIGAAAAYLVLGVAAGISDDPATARAAWIAMELIGWYGIVPISILALITGLIMSLGTPWGLFRHYWVLIALVLTVVSLIVLILHMPTVTADRRPGPHGRRFHRSPARRRCPPPRSRTCGADCRCGPQSLQAARPHHLRTPPTSQSAKPKPQHTR